MSRLAIDAGCKELFQPRGKNNGSYITFQTDLLEYIGVFTPDTEVVAKDTLVKFYENLDPLPLVERIDRRSVRLDEIHMGGRDGDLEKLSAEMRHGASLLGGAKMCTTFPRFQV